MPYNSENKIDPFAAPDEYQDEDSQSPEIIGYGNNLAILKAGQKPTNDFGEEVSQDYVQDIQDTLGMDEPAFQNKLAQQKASIPNRPSDDEIDLFEEWKQFEPEARKIASKRLGGLDPDMEAENAASKVKRTYYGNMDASDISLLTPMQKQKIDSEANDAALRAKEKAQDRLDEEMGFARNMFMTQMKDKLIAKSKLAKEGISPEAVKLEGAKYLLTGKLPFTGMGGLGKREMINESGRIAEENGWTSNMVLRMQADFKSLDKSLSSQRKNYDAMNGFVINMDKQMERLEEIYSKLPRAQYRLLNVPLVKLRSIAEGSGEEASAAALLIELGNESGKLSTNSAASIRELSEGAQKQWSKIHDNTLSMAELKKVLDTTRQLGHDRLESTRKAMEFTAEGIESLGGGRQQDKPAAQEGSARSAPRVGEIKSGYRFKGGNPADKNSWEKI